MANGIGIDCAIMTVASVVVIDRSGKGRTVTGEVGLSIMQMIKENGFDDLVALCGGCCSCATCHVYVDRSFASVLPGMSPDEEALLDSSEHRKDNSRLSCQVELAGAMNGMTVTIAPEG